MLLSHGRDEPVKKETDFTAERLGFFLIKLIFYLCTSELPNLCTYALPNNSFTLGQSL